MQERGITSQAELARRSGLTPAHVSRLFSRQTGGGRKLYDGLAKALGVSKDEVLQRAGELLPGDTISQARDWSARLLAMSEGDRRATIAAMEAALAAVEASLRFRQRQ
jgi:transcriptional regulator with XRE-family HTH domain